MTLHPEEILLAKRLREAAARVSRETQAKLSSGRFGNFRIELEAEPRGIVLGSSDIKCRLSLPLGEVVAIIVPLGMLELEVSRREGIAESDLQFLVLLVFTKRV